MQTQPRISVILPFYNAEQTLSACLESIRSQSLRELEILAVDDGSTDSSAAIVG
ncbi:MAG: glycosyltransferase, partial [Clostridia bacterium]|nr:glycosyltransferase [Clostridia bacterium]